MLQENNQTPEEQAPDVEVDPAKLEQLLSEMTADQNLVSGILAGFVASLIGAAIWAVITVATGYQIGFMAIGVGFIVGYAVRTAGKGISSIYGVVGAVLALIGCLAGNLFSICGTIAKQESVSFFEIIGQLNPKFIMDLMVATFSAMDLLFYGIAIYEGYRLSLRKITEEELGRLAQTTT